MRQLSAQIAEHVCGAGMHREEAGSEDDEPKLDYLTAEDMKRAKQQGQAERAREKAAEAAAERRASPVSKALKGSGKRESGVRPVHTMGA